MERVLGLTAHLSPPIATAVTLVAKSVDDLVPRLSDLIENVGVWLLALVCKRKCVLCHYPFIIVTTLKVLAKLTVKRKINAAD